LAGIGDAPTAFQIDPVGVTTIGMTHTHKDFNFSIDGSRAEPAARIISNIVAIPYVRVSKLNGQAVGFIVYVYAPFVKISLDASKVAEKFRGRGYFVGSYYWYTWYARAEAYSLKQTEVL